MASIATPAEERFLQWLIEHGAQFPKIQWPSVTPNGLRGATAREAIATNEVMVSIPHTLLISEATCWRDATLCRVYEENRDLFARDDPVLALFVVQELVKGEASFYGPYLSILPHVETIQDWTPAEQAELRDPILVESATRRKTEMTVAYCKIMQRLDEKYPGEFPANEYTFARFSFAWKNIQARTFGRRLPWTALVPFADCLNHANVATKYDCDMASTGTGTFRLFPSASTHFAAGAEVFNSYGRRPNAQLLLDYGFALEDNEWDYVEIDLPRDTAQILGRRFPFRKRLRLERQTTVDTLFPFSTFPIDTPIEDSHEEAIASTVLGEHKARREALLWFRELVADTMDRFETTLDDDEIRLVDDRLSDRMRLAIVYRSGRLRILVQFVQALDEAVVHATHRTDNDLHKVTEVASSLQAVRIE